MNHLGTKQIESSRLILRRFTEADATSMFQNWANDSEVTKYLMWPTHESIEVTRQVLKEWIASYEKPDFYLWGIVLKDSGTLIGSIGVVLQKDQTNMVHMGYCIGRQWWHKGYTSEALSGLVTFFFEEVGANRIESRHDPSNPNSGKVMEKAGLQYEGTLRESDWNNQGICDATYYAILARDYFNRPNEREAPTYVRF